MIKFRNFALVLCGISAFFYFSNACSVTDNKSSQKAKAYLHVAGPFRTGGMVHILATASAVSNAFKLESTLDGNIVVAPDSNCPADCLIELTPMEFYNGPNNDSITMARPVDYNYYNLLGFYNRTPLPETQKIYCAPTKGWCGADVNLYRYVSFAYNDYYVTTAIQYNATYGVDNLGVPICYGWDGSSTSSSKDKLKLAGILLGIAIATLLIIGFIALVTVFFIKSGKPGNKVDGLYQGDQSDAPPRLVESQQTHEPVHHERKPNRYPQQKKHFDISDPRGDVSETYMDD